MRIGKAYQILGLEEGASIREIKETWRRLRTELHPDKHPELGLAGQRAFAEASEAYETALAHAKEPVPCEVCEGKGYVETRVGWRSLNMPCGACDGEGEVPPSDDDEE